MGKAGHDEDRSFEFAAALQTAEGDCAPTLIGIETKAGHGLGKPSSKLVAEAADLGPS